MKVTLHYFPQKTFSRNVNVFLTLPPLPKRSIQKVLLKKYQNRQTNAQMSCLLQWCIQVDTMRQFGQGRWNRSQAMEGLNHPFVIATEVILGNCRKCLLWPCPRAAIRISYKPTIISRIFRPFHPAKVVSDILSSFPNRCTALLGCSTCAVS